MLNKVLILISSSFSVVRCSQAKESTENFGLKLNTVWLHNSKRHHCGVKFSSVLGKSKLQQGLLAPSFKRILHQWISEGTFHTWTESGIFINKMSSSIRNTSIINWRCPFIFIRHNTSICIWADGGDVTRALFVCGNDPFLIELITANSHSYIILMNVIGIIECLWVEEFSRCLKGYISSGKHIS